MGGRRDQVIGRRPPWAHISWSYCKLVNFMYKIHILINQNSYNKFQWLRVDNFPPNYIPNRFVNKRSFNETKQKRNQSILHGEGGGGYQPGSQKKKNLERSFID